MVLERDVRVAGQALPRNEEYDPATDRWRLRAPLPQGRDNLGVAAVNGKIYVFGGFVAPATTAIPLGAAWEPIADAWEFTPATDSWKPLAPLPRRTAGKRSQRTRKIRR